MDRKVINMSTGKEIKYGTSYMKGLINNGYKLDGDYSYEPDYVPKEVNQPPIEYLSTLPDEIVKEIIKKLHLPEIFNICLVSKKLRSFCKDKSINREFYTFLTNKKIISCGSYDTMIVSNNKLYVTGNNEYGKLGLDVKKK